MKSFLKKKIHPSFTACSDSGICVTFEVLSGRILHVRFVLSLYRVCINHKYSKESVCGPNSNRYYFYVDFAE